MDRRLARTGDRIRFRVDATRCDGQGVCVLVAPEVFELDRYGYAYVVAGSDQLAAEDDDVRSRGLEADALCPRNAIREELLADILAPVADTTDPVDGVAHSSRPARLVLGGDEPESLEAWRSRGGWQDRDAQDLLDLVSAAGIRGHGGAAFPAHVKWQRVIGADAPVVVVNAAEREPGTVKDRYLLANRPYLVLDGLRCAMRAVGANVAIVGIDEDAQDELAVFRRAVDEATVEGLIGGLQVRIELVPARYVAGEETALLSVIEGAKPLPRARPPFPSDIGVFGRPTLVHNVETLAQIAVCAAIGVDAFRAPGVEDQPGTGIFSVGRFGEACQPVERPYGYLLRDLLAECGLLEGARAVLVGGYAGGLVAPADFDVALTSSTLAAAGASLGTKSVQVIGADTCPVEVAGRIVTYFGEETAQQCPPCFRGLPDMAEILRSIESGTSTPDTRETLQTFMSTLFDRGVCRLPDGAARLTLSLLTHFAEDVERHVEAGGCPLRL